MPIGSVRRFRRALHHVIVVQRIPDIPGLEVPVLYLVEPHPEHGEVLRPLHELTSYFVAHSAMSMTWMLQRARGIGMLLDYVRQRRDHFRELAQEKFLNIHRRVSAEFQNHLVHGTVQFDESGARDSTDLFWPPCSSPDNVLELMRAVQDFVQWLHDDGYGDRINAIAGSDDELPHNGRDIVRFLYVARYRRNVSLLAHIKRKRRSRLPNRNIVGRDGRTFAAPEPAQFPLQYLAPLVLEGFISAPDAKQPWDREDLAGKLATLKCAFGGLRGSEPLHLWLNDVQLIDGEPVVFLQHPIRAMVIHETYGSMSREEYLRSLCGMEPRNRIGGKFHAGWKGIKCNSNWWAPLYWLPFDGIKELFWDTFQTYVFEVRPRLMWERRRRGLSDHPFLLVSSGGPNHEGDETSVGDPYTCAAYRNAWRRAMSRLRKRYEDPALEVMKPLGTTRHGLRHLYGALLKGLGLPPDLRQECMHHISPLSQQIYGQPHNQHISAILSEAAEKARRGDFPQFEPHFRNLSDALGQLCSYAKEPLLSPRVTQ